MLDPAEHLIPFIGVQHIENENGYVVWRRGSGDNAELLHIRASELRQGRGRLLLRAMLIALKDAPPRDTVFGFTRASNEPAIAFYTAMGFRINLVWGLYEEGAAVLFSARYDRLCAKHLEGS